MIDTTTTDAAPPVDDTIQSTPADLPPLIDADLNFSEGYQARIGEYAENSTFKNLSDVFKTNKELQSTLGRVNTEKAELSKTLESLKADPPTEMPADAEEYKGKLTIPELPEGMELGPEVLDSAIAFAMEKGYGPEALSDFLSFDLKRAEMEGESAKLRAEEETQSAIKTISDVVGEANLEMTFSNANNARNSLNLPLSEESMKSNPEMVIALSQIHNKLSEGTLKGAAVGISDSAAAGSKLQQANDIVSDPNHALYAAFKDDSHSQHQWALSEHSRLIAEYGKER